MKHQSETLPQKRRGLSCKILIGIGALVLICGIFAVIVINISEPEISSVPTDTPALDAPPSPPPIDTPTVDAPPSPPPTETLPPPPPTDTPAPVYRDPVILFEVSGVGAQVTENYWVTGCNKAVFYWSAQASDIGTASLIAVLHSVATGEERTIVNDFAMDLTGDLTGAALQPLADGQYFISTENTDQAWRIRLECQDGQAPVAAGIDIQGQGVFVTPNYELPGCTKSVFMWTTQPGDTGSASLIADLVSVSENRSYNLANDFAMDLTAPLEGEALRSTTPGLYYLVIENTQQPWHIRWECRD